MIPQDPVLFSGDVRFNVDPFNASSDEEVRSALVDAQLEARTSLDAQVEEGGRNFSLGERQLLCLARACLTTVQTIAAGRGDECCGRSSRRRRSERLLEGRSGTLPWFVSPTGSTRLVITTACWS